jgi:outer membrane biosynthesis protein TonB
MGSACKKLAILVVIPLVLLGGCKKKKPPVPPPPQQTAPTITQPQPPVQQPPVQPPPPPAQQQPSVTTTQPTQPPATATKPKPKHKRHVAKKPTEPQKNKTVVKEGGEPASSGQLAAGIPQDEATHQRQSTAQLRQASENTLRGLNRQLSSDEQAMVQQVRAYLAQSRAADNDGDTERAYNLALKAHLLSDELTKR